MTDRDPIGSAIRRTRRDERLGEGPRVCLLCGYAELEALIPVTLGWLRDHGISDLQRLLEDHHVYGKAHDPEFVVPLCRNCHAEVTEGLRQEGVSMLPEPNPVARVAIALDARAFFCEREAAALRRQAAILRETLQPGGSK